jgi:hypothetical protein
VELELYFLEMVFWLVFPMKKGFTPLLAGANTFGLFEKE